MGGFYFIKTAFFGLFLFLFPLNFLQAQITINTDFEGGNGVATFIDEENNEVHISSELKAGDTKNIVYYVQISGLNVELPLTLMVDAFWRGHELVYSFDQINWQKAHLTNLNNFNIPLTSSTIYIAHTYPYTYSDMIADVNAISDLEFVDIYDLATSQGGRSVKLVKITDDCIPDVEKELIWIFGRMHAFENTGNLSVIGMMDYFTSNQQSAQRLRKEAIIYIVPMMDVDMAFIGGSGKDQEPVDFNRDWMYVDHPSHWEAVSSAKAWIDSTAQMNNLSVFFDSHSPAPSHGETLFYYVYDLPRVRANIDFINETIEQIGNYRGEDYIFTGLDISTSQDYAFSIYDNPRLYNITMETGFGLRPDGEEWTRELYLLHGEYHGRAISDFIHGHAYENDIIVDNQDESNVEINGNWIENTSVYGFLGEDYLTVDNESPASIVFQATIDSTGVYEIFTRWISNPDFATNARASFSHSEGTVDYIIDMTNRGGNWISLDTLALNEGEQVSLTIRNNGANGTVVADGLRISQITECQTLAIPKIEKPHFDFKLFPNPATTGFTVQLVNEALLEIVEVYDLFGKLVLTSNKNTIENLSLPEGLYLVVVKTNQGKAVKKLIVK